MSYRQRDRDIGGARINICEREASEGLGHVLRSCIRHRRSDCGGIVDRQDGDLHIGCRQAALAVRHRIGKGDSAAEVRGRMERELAIEAERHVAMRNGDGRAARNHGMAVDGRDGEGIAVGRAVTVVGAHVEGDRCILVGGRQIVRGHRRDVLGAEHEVLGDRGSARVFRRDGYVVIAIVLHRANRSVRMQRTRDLAGGGVNAQTQRQTCRGERERIALRIGERTLGDDQHGRTIEAGLVAERNHHLRRVVDRHDMDGCRRDVGREATAVGGLHRKGPVIGARILRGVLI